MNPWKQVEELVKKAEEQRIRLALNQDGDRARVVFLGDPFAREAAFIDGKYVPFDESHHAMGLRPSCRVSITVVRVDTGEVKVLERSVMFFKELASLRERLCLDDWSFEIVRIGAAGDRATTYRIGEPIALGPEERDAYARLARYDLSRLAAGEVAKATPRLLDRSRARVRTIPRLQANAIVRALRALSRDARRRFLRQFAVQRVRDVATEQLADAMSFVDRLVRDAEIAPFA
jgi:hypothetical protein